MILQVCPVEAEWTADIIPKLRSIDVMRLSGGKTSAAATAAAKETASGKHQLGANIGGKEGRRNDGSAVNAARERFLERKRLKGSARGK